MYVFPVFTFATVFVRLDLFISRYRNKDLCPESVFATSTTCEVYITLEECRAPSCYGNHTLETCTDIHQFVCPSRYIRKTHHTLWMNVQLI